jgi:hypothetical protein
MGYRCDGSEHIRVVNHGVKVSKLFHDFLHCPLAVASMTHIADHWQRLYSHCADLLGNRLKFIH